MARNQRRPALHGLVLALIAFGVFSSLFVSKVFPLDLDHGPIAGLSLPSVGVSAPDVPVLTADILPDTIAREEFEDGLLVIASEAPPEPNAAAAQPAKPKPPPLFQRYNAQTGDTASSIAARFGITLQYLLWNNQELRDGDFLKVGHVLWIPAGNGILHYVSFGETLGAIAGYYGVEPGPIMAWAGNSLSSPDQIKDGELIFVPEGVPPAPAIPEPTAVPVAVQAPVPVPPPPPPPPPATSAPTSNSGLSWPYSCQISRGFGGGHNGIDIAGACNPSAAIGAATSGTVVSAVTSTFNGYGHYVDIMSPDGIRTRYAHLSSVHVSIGQQVSQGQSLGIIGATGNSTGVHLHFEVRINGSLVSPLSYLP